LLLKYRDMARMIWNLAFWPIADLRDGDCFTVGDYTAAFDEAIARLYEGMVLLPLGRTERVQDINHPGRAVALSVEVNSPNVECLIDQNLPTDPGHTWKAVGVPITPGAYEFEFRGFFDWEQLGHREFSFAEVLIQRMDARPEDVGHHALIPVSECSVWAGPV